MRGNALNGEMTSRHIRAAGAETNGGNLRDILGNFFHLISNDQQRGIEPETQLSRGFPSSGEVVCAKDLVGESFEIMLDETKLDLEKLSCKMCDDRVVPDLNEKSCQIPTSLHGAIKDAVSSRSETWVYDWIHDLKDSQDADRSMKYLKLSSISIVKLIREELHYLHTQMV